MRYLLLHGFTGTPESFGYLSLPAGCAAPVLGGHLGTPVLGDFWHEVERLSSLAEGCEGLLGYSLGGRLALGLLARHPARFAHALIVSAQPGLVTAAEREARRDSDAGFVWRLHEEGLSGFVDAWQTLPLWASQGALPDAVKQAQRSQRLRHTAEGLAHSLLRHGLAEMPDLRPQLAHVSSRVDLLVGERDEKFVTLGHELAALMPAARLTVAAGAGHNLLLERPEHCCRLLLQGTPL
ncbi:MAG TPA: alpha/beta fold hydrolase [Polyangiaceae bacterium]|nr:alpha/beta fold hydrolase [Polyangiaceae bacterium]